MNVHRQTVAKAVHSGRIETKRDGRIHLVHAETAKKQWGLNTNKKMSDLANMKKTKKEKVEDNDPAYEAYKVQKYEGFTTADADRKDKFYKAKLSELKFKEQSGQLVDSEEIKKEAFEVGRKLRDTLMSMPARLSHELAVETDPHMVEVLLTREIIKALDKHIGKINESV